MDEPKSSAIRFAASLIMVLAATTVARAQPRWESQRSGTQARLRGVAAVSPSIAWASGAKGTILRTLDAGATWTPRRVPDSEGLDFRDLHAIDDRTAFVLSIGPGELSRILKSSDGGATWTLSYGNRDPRVFLDAIAFWDEARGIALGDPVDGRFTILITDDGGRTWSGIPPNGMPRAMEGEGAFAASGTCLVVGPGGLAWFGTGGARVARVFRSSDRGRTWTVAETPIVAGTASSGIFSVSFRDERHGIAVGGDYRATDRGGHVVAVTADGGGTWTEPKGPGPRAFRSAVVHLPGEGPPAAIAAGPSGSEISLDDGESWHALPDDGFHALGLARGDRRDRCVGWGVGEDGRIARIRIGPESP
ncbi:WD40/YVTN/BNR-like repeat-containing protein [Aquisphaera insulae]|uniref:WD40/YVTN/BNR-like repeat-containing protein n=1 Tax=Aquisphaera insulae TaxID=2712864 RepID=UPI0013EAF291|nr:hypothetical protein [Aquisphaera insulae]